MKELSIEEKAKAYDDLLVKLQKAKEDNDVCDDRYCCVIDAIVPELAEPEDERIRKTLVAFFTDWHKTRSHCWGISVPEILDWLENQAEQKHAWDENDEACANMILRGLEQDKIDSPDYSRFFARLIDWLKSLKERRAWKPTVEQMDALNYVIQHYTPEATDRLAWDALKTVEIMRMQLNKLK